MHKLIEISLAVVVAIVCLTGLLIPIVNGSTDDIHSITKNEIGDKYTYAVEATPDLTIKVGDGVILVNDYPLNINIQTVLAGCSTYCVFTFNNTTLYVLHEDNYKEVKASTEITIVDGVLTYTATTDQVITVNPAGTVIYADNVNPTYYRIRSASTSDTFNFNNDSVIYYNGNANFTNADLTPNSLGAIIFGFGTVDDMDIYLCNSAVTGNTMELKSVTESNGYNVSTSVYDATLTDSVGTYATAETGVNFSSYVPISYHEITSTDNAVITLIDLLPLLIVISVILGVVIAVVKTRV